MRIPLKTLAGLSCLVVLGNSLSGSTEEHPEVERGTPPAVALKWQGQEGRTYFMKSSLDLQTWLYDLHIKSGTGSQISHGFSSSSSQLFLRLAVSVVPTDDPELSDFDMDGVGNQAELNAGSDPLDADTDNDGVVDGMDIDPLDPVDGNPLYAGDSDGDGLLDSEELVLGTSPTLSDSDGDGYADGVDLFPFDSSRWSLSSINPADTTGPTVTLEAPANATYVSGP